MKRFAALSFALAIMLSGCVTPIGPVEVTRFSAPQAALGQGTIAVEAAPGMDANGIEFRTFQSAVERQLGLVGYSSAPGGQGGQVAQVRLSRTALETAGRGGPVSVGVGGSTGSYGSGIGVGVGINLGNLLAGQPRRQIATELGVMIRDRATGKTLWEGRASYSVPQGAPSASNDLGAGKMAEALFKGFPGRSGETIRVP